MVLIVNTNVAVLSHPTEFVPTHVYVPDDVYVTHSMCNHYELIVVLDDVELFIVNVKKTVLSHPLTSVAVHV